MQDNQGQNTSHAAGSQLPEGVFPPMKGYTNAELATAACQSVDKFFKESKIDPTLAKESLFELFNYLTAAYEDANVDYQISTWYQKPYNDPAVRAESVKAMAKEFNALTIRTAGKALVKSPLGGMSRDFQGRFLDSAGMGVQNLIETLNKPGA
ncbi:hypothetical protein ACIPZF_20770 [Pseudomonas sp. NPDC089752]|uniref:hypothetical protein n=1 Tax=Pseudomonas sp. NPDC089752 TaxID=3364472 RepID=UPI0037F2D855